MKTILVLLATILLSCEKNEEYCWDCNQQTIIYPNWCDDIDTLNQQSDKCGMTEREILMFMKFESSNIVKDLGNKMTLTFVTTMHCQKYTCLEY
jgi:hypothetical protein